MRSLSRSLLILLTFFSLPLCALAQSSQKTGTGVITGRVMLGDKPVPNITVALAPGDPGPQRKSVAQATTDFEGNYRLTGVPAGRYNVAPLAPTMIGPTDPMYGMPGRSVLISEGEIVEKIDFTLARGGVITGRITDADGKPVIEERVQLSPVDNSMRERFGFYSNPFMLQTDDRGVYRIYGVPAGRYTLSVGISPQEGMVRVGLVRRGYYQRTFYPGETDIKKAGIIEVSEGGEVKDIDIKLGRQAQAFTVSGKVVDADTGRPVPNVLIGYGSYRPNEKRLMSFGFGESRTDARGQFRIEGIVPGRYAAFVWAETGAYSEPAPFELTDADVSGLEIKMRRGASLSGVAQIEGTSDKRVLSRLQQLNIGAYIQSRELGPPETRPTTIGADGSFRLTGLPPGKATLFLAGYPPVKDIRLVRVERDGVAQPNGIEITPGAEITNVRLIFEYGSGSIRGQVRVENGQLPEGATMYVTVVKPDEAQPNTRPAGAVMADSRGHFLLEGLAPGDYQIILRFRLLQEINRRLPTVKQNVTVSSGMETETTLVLDLTEKATEGNNP